MSRASLTLSPLLRYRKLWLLPSSSARAARQAFHRNPRLYHLPIVSETGQYQALFPKRSLIKAHPQTLLESLPWDSFPSLPPYATIYDALQKMEELRTPEIAITNEEGLYLGLITTDSLVRWWSHLGAVQEPGAVLILESYLRDYSLAEIAQILESDEIRILSAYLLRHDTDLQKTYIVLKVNSIYLARTIELLERKNYRVVGIHGDLLMEKDARDQLNALLRYLSI
ncbi:MAG: CBS domain-containing protein [Bacteroidia bacterium]|nr:CBS domain-containing protein [Bacteroidia bacterium]